MTFRKVENQVGEKERDYFSLKMLTDIQYMFQSLLGLNNSSAFLLFLFCLPFNKSLLMCV